MNLEFSVADMISKFKGIFMRTFLSLDIIFALFQLFPNMSVVLFIMIYLMPYAVMCILFILVSIKNPGFKQRRSGLEMLELLIDFYDNVENSNSSIQQAKDVSAKFCFECNIVKKKTRHCDICNKCVENFDHHCPYILNCVGKNNHNLFLVFLIVSTVFLSLRFILSLLSSVNVICFAYKEQESYQNKVSYALFKDFYDGFVSSCLNILNSLTSAADIASQQCIYNYSSFGSFGEGLKDLYEHNLGIKIFTQTINWLHIILNLLIVIMVIILTKVSLCNFFDGVTTYEKHLRKNAERDTSIERELRQNFLDNNKNEN